MSKKEMPCKDDFNDLANVVVLYVFAMCVMSAIISGRGHLIDVLWNMLRGTIAQGYNAR